MGLNEWSTLHILINPRAMLFVGKKECILDIITVNERVTVTFNQNEDYVEELRQSLSDVEKASVIIDKVKFVLGDPNSPEVLSEYLPGVNLKVKHPVSMIDDKVRNIIIDLNDFHEWTPDQVADWLDETLAIEDMTFEAPEVNNGKAKLRQVTSVVKIKRVLSSGLDG